MRWGVDGGRACNACGAAQEKNRRSNPGLGVRVELCVVDCGLGAQDRQNEGEGKAALAHDVDENKDAGVRVPSLTSNCTGEKRKYYL